MAELRVVQAPEKVLNQIAKPVNYKEKKLRQLLLDMVETLQKHTDPPGVGLAAPQVGVSKRIFIALLGTPGTEDELDQGYYKIFINPQIISVSGSSNSTKSGRQTAEGCLSLKKYYGQVNRGTKVKIKFETVDIDQLKKNPHPNWKKIIQTQTLTFKNFEARIMQHEVDHLEGRLFTSRIIEQQGQLFELQRKKTGKEKWTEVELDI